jgi:transcription elongation factor Elf1
MHVLRHLGHETHVTQDITTTEAHSQFVAMVAHLRNGIQRNKEEENENE